MYVENACRTCLTWPSGESYLIYNKKDEICLADKLIIIADITVAKNDGLPNRVCDPCKRKIEMLYAFKYQIENSHRTLTQLTSSNLKHNYEQAAVRPTVSNFSMEQARKESEENTTESIKVEVDIPANETNPGFKGTHKANYKPSIKDELQHATQMTTYNWPNDLNEFVFPSMWTNIDEGVGCSTARPTNEAQAQVQTQPRNLVNQTGKFVCELCNACFVRKYSYTLHCQQNFCTKKQHKCERCGRFFITEQHLIEHSTSHEHQTNLICFKCKMEFPTMEELGNHMKAAHNWMFQCGICKRVFQSDSHLRRHQRVHTEEKPYECNICQKKFAWAETLKRHLGRHAGKKTIRCQYCDWMFLTRDECRKHERVHTGEKKFVCEYCNSRFGKSSNLKIHIRTHTGERPFACDYCPMRFTVASTRDKHRRMHTGEKPFKCKLCNANFTQKSSLLSHRRKCTGLE